MINLANINPRLSDFASNQVKQNQTFNQTFGDYRPLSIYDMKFLTNILVLKKYRNH